MSIEKECLECVKKNKSEYSICMQNYKIDILMNRRITENTDIIFAYYLLSLLSNGNIKEYSLNRAAIEEVIDLGEFKYVRLVDSFCMASRLGNQLQMQQAIEGLPKGFAKIGEKAFHILRDQNAVVIDAPVETEQKNKIERVINLSNMFFRV
ncbi:hypothetical protein NEOKW01_0210 [Nematocida sp. AWRm80]|nr:hypothetical protein NEOKW01_0210 [Nematocida sp. AWRm80]